jgi:hypothetical protein
MTGSARRLTIGLMALLLFVAAAVFRLGFDSDLDGLYGICAKVGLTLAAAWLAYPQIELLSAYCSPRLLLTILVGGVLVIARPRTFPIVVALVAVVGLLEVAGWLLKPLRPPDKPRDGTRRNGGRA